MPALIAMATAGVLLAQLTPTPTTTQQRLEQLEQADRATKAAEAAKWRTFPKPLPIDPSDTYNPLDHKASMERLIRSAGSWMQDPRSTGSISCDYNWAAWKLDPATGIRSTDMRCGSSYHRAVAVNCSTLQLSTSDFNPQPPPTAQVARSFQRWWHWRLPSNEGQRQMVVALCDNLSSTGKEVR